MKTRFTNPAQRLPRKGATTKVTSIKVATAAKATTLVEFPCQRSGPTPRVGNPRPLRRDRRHRSGYPNNENSNNNNNNNNNKRLRKWIFKTTDTSTTISRRRNERRKRRSELFKTRANPFVTNLSFCLPIYSGRD